MWTKKNDSARQNLGFTFRKSTTLFSANLRAHFSATFLRRNSSRKFCANFKEAENKKLRLLKNTQLTPFNASSI